MPSTGNVAIPWAAYRGCHFANTPSNCCTTAAPRFVALHYACAVRSPCGELALVFLVPVYLSEIVPSGVEERVGIFIAHLGLRPFDGGQIRRRFCQVFEDVRPDRLG